MNRVNATKRFCSIVTGVVLVLAALMLVAFAGVRLFGLTPYAVLSGSMEPEYPTGSLIYVRDVDPADVAVGDAITAFAGVRLFGLTPYAVLSGSMEPEYPTGSLIYVRDVDPADVAVGDAITFELSCRCGGGRCHHLRA